MFTCADTELWMRLSSLLHYGGTSALQKLWKDSTVTGIQPNGAAIYNKIVATIRRNQVFAPQRHLVFPSNGHTDVTKFDISLHVKLLLELNVFGTPDFQKSHNLPPLDLTLPTTTVAAKTIGDFLQYLKDARNFLLHHEPISISQNDFDIYWDNIEKILTGLRYNVAKVAELKTGLISCDSHFIYSVALSKALYQEAQLKRIQTGIMQLAAVGSTGVPLNLASIMNKLDQVDVNVNDAKNDIVEELRALDKKVLKGLDELREDSKKTAKGKLLQN